MYIPNTRMYFRIKNCRNSQLNYVQNNSSSYVHYGLDAIGEMARELI